MKFLNTLLFALFLSVSFTNVSQAQYDFGKINKVILQLITAAVEKEKDSITSLSVALDPEFTHIDMDSNNDKLKFESEVVVPKSVWSNEESSLIAVVQLENKEIEEGILVNSRIQLGMKTNMVNYLKYAAQLYVEYDCDSELEEPSFRGDLELSACPLAEQILEAKGISEVIVAFERYYQDLLVLEKKHADSYAKDLLEEVEHLEISFENNQIVISIDYNEENPTNTSITNFSFQLNETSMVFDVEFSYEASNTMGQMYSYYKNEIVKDLLEDIQNEDPNVLSSVENYLSSLIAISKELFLEEY